MTQALIWPSSGLHLARFWHSSGTVLHCNHPRYLGTLHLASRLPSKTLIHPQASLLFPVTFTLSLYLSPLISLPPSLFSLYLFLSLSPELIGRWSVLSAPHYLAPSLPSLCQSVRVPDTHVPALRVCDEAMRMCSRLIGAHFSPLAPNYSLTAACPPARHAAHRSSRQGHPDARTTRDSSEGHTHTHTHTQTITAISCFTLKWRLRGAARQPSSLIVSHGQH